MAEYRKAIVAALVAGLAALSTALVDGDVTALDATLIASAVVAALATVWGIPNKPQV